MSAEGSVLAVVVSSDGRWIVTGDAGSKVIVWDAYTHEKATEMGDHTNWVRTVDVSRDSTRVVSGSYDKTVRISSITTGQNLISPLPHDRCVVGVKFSPAGDRIATAIWDRSSVSIYDSFTGSKLFDIPVRVRTYPVTPLAWSHDGRLLFAASPGKITCLDTSTSSRSHWPIKNLSSQVSIATYGRFIACAAGCSVSFWDSISREQIRSTLNCPVAISSITISPDGRYLACGHGDTISVHQIDQHLPNNYTPPPSSRSPLMEVSITALDTWLKDDQESAESILSEEIRKRSNSNHHILANRALVRAHLKRWDTALEDANMSLQIKPSPIGHVAKAIALLGVGKTDLALSEFDFSFCVSDPIDIKFLFVIKSIVLFDSGNYKDAIFRVSGLITNADEDTKCYSIQVLGNMYLKKGDYEAALRSLKDAPRIGSPDENPHLMTISLIFGWNFCGIETTAWTRLCEILCTSGRVKEVGENLLKMVDFLAEGKREAAHCRILEEIVTRSGDVALLSWVGQSSSYNSCLPASPAAYTQTLFTLPTLEGAEMESRIAELLTALPQIDALIIHDCITRLQPVRFANRRLLLPCLPFRVRSLRKNERNTYSAKVACIGDIDFTTDDNLPLKEPQRLVFVHPWIRYLRGPQNGHTSDNESDAGTDTISTVSSGLTSEVCIDAEMVHVSLVEEVPEVSLAPLDQYNQALRLIARLGQPFNALLFLGQTDGTYKRVAVEREIVVPGLGRNVPRDIRAEILEVV